MKNFKPVTSAEREKRIKLLAELTSYQVEWVSQEDPDSIAYDSGCLEGAAHAIACAITQWFTNDSTPTSDVVTFLDLRARPTRKQIESRLRKLIKLLEYES